MGTQNRLCYELLDTVKSEDGQFIPCIMEEGVSGYRKTDWLWGTDRKIAEECRDQKNEGLGLSRAEAIAIVVSSMKAEPINNLRANDLTVKSSEFSFDDPETYSIVSFYDPFENYDESIDEMLVIADKNGIDIPWEDSDPREWERERLCRFIENEGIEFNPEGETKNLAADFLSVYPRLFINANALASAIDEKTREDKVPMMNFVWPVTVVGSAEELQVDLLGSPVVLVEINDNLYFALSGGGMDFSWELAEAYIAAGQYPPVDLCYLPNMAGENRIGVVKVCQRGLEIAQGLLNSARNQLAFQAYTIHTRGRL